MAALYAMTALFALHGQSFSSLRLSRRDDVDGYQGACGGK